MILWLLGSGLVLLLLGFPVFLWGKNLTTLPGGWAAQFVPAMLVALGAPFALCTACGETAKLAVLERMNVRSVRPELLDQMHDNDPGLAAELLQDPGVRRRSRIALDWDNAWRLDTGGSDHLDREVLDVSVRFAARIPVRPVRLIAEGCGLSRAEVERLITEGKLVSAVRLNGKLSGDFTFTLKR
ncbi:DUF1062 domain-containing protein [Streptomyces mirabilis]|uniref:DUF1062 domain-containing protein n=1 Tax=Streptomyces mirabilis TaxID=68239 RepID=UPI0036289BD6